MTIRISGNIWLSRIQPRPTLEIRPRCRARTYAAGSPITTVRIAVTLDDLDAVPGGVQEAVLVDGVDVVLERRLGWDQVRVQRDQLLRPLERDGEHPEQREPEEQHVAAEQQVLDDPGRLLAG